MTKAQRAKQNRLNAQKSTGPKTEAGKEKSRRNALRHGLTAELLTLPNETVEDIAALTADITEAMQPLDAAEDLCVRQAVVASLRFGRAAATEVAMIADQTRTAVLDWDRQQELRCVEATRLLRKDPALGYIELKSFGAGVNWLLDQWKVLKEGFDKHGYWNNLELIKVALRLQGYNPDTLNIDALPGYNFALQAVCCVPKFEEDRKLLDLVTRFMNPAFEGAYGKHAEYEREEAMERVRETLEEEVAYLNRLKTIFDVEDNERRASAKVRAQVPAATPEGKLIIRYIKDAETSLEKSFKNLAKLRSDRAKEAANAVFDEPETAPEPEPVGIPFDSLLNEPRNEADAVGKVKVKRIRVGTYVKINGTRYEAVDVSDGNLVLVPEVQDDAPGGSDDELIPVSMV